MSHSSTAVRPARTDANRDGFGNALLRLGLRLVMPLTDLPVAIFTFVVTVTGVTLSFGLVPLFLIGIPLFAWVGALARGMATFERKRMKLFLDIEIPKPLTRPRGIKAALKHRPTWRAIAYHVVQFPLAVLTFSVAVAGWGTALALISMPWWLHQTPSKRADIWMTTINDQGSAWLTALGGLAIGCIAIGLTIGLTTAEGAVARAMLGVSSQELAQRVDELQGSRARVVDAAEAERRRIERDLHDGAQQRLVALAMNLGRAKARYDEDPEAARRLLDEAHNDAKHALVELRDLARGLHPAVLTDRGLDAALSGLAGRSPIPVTLDVNVDPRCTPTIEAIAYFVVSEALANAAKHSGAHGIDVVAHRVGDRLRLLVTDDGVGGAVPGSGTGLAGLADRVGGVDGTFVVNSPTGGPTVLTVELPCVS
ncbi:MAG: sensor histidine kinase [Acidothermaceae bacterium]